MTDSCNQEPEGSGDVSTSDDESVSLLCDLNVCQSRGAAEDTEMSDLDSQVGKKEEEKEVELEINRLKPPESGVSSTQSAACSTKSTAQLAANASHCVKIPNKLQLNKRNEKGETLLHKACQRKDLARVRVLIKAGISINMEDYAGWTALHEASAVGAEEVVAELLKAGANVNARSFDGVTPLHDAVFSGHYQVVKLLLRYGSNASDRNAGGLSALDMVKEENIKELLLTSPVSPFMHKQAHEPPARCLQAGDASSEAHCHMQLSSRGSLSPSRSDTANVQPRESGDRDGATGHSDIQPRKKDTSTDNLSSSEALSAVLEEVGRKHTEMSTWPLACREDAGRYHAALTHIHNVLIEVLAKQHMEKDSLAQNYWSAPDCLRQCVFESQLVSLASRQKTLVEVLQRQMHLVEVYVTMKARLSTQSPNQTSISGSMKAGKAQIDQGSQLKESHKQVTEATLFRSTPPNNAKDLPLPAPPVPVPAKGSKQTHLSNKRASSCQTNASQPRAAPYHISFQIDGHNALTQKRAEDNSRPLSKLMQRGVMASGSTLQLLLKDQWHLAHVLGDGLIKDSKGKSHWAPEHWLESILGNNIPVSSAYAWDKVMFRDRPLSYYLLNTETEGNTPQMCPKHHVQCCRAWSSEEELPTEAANLNHLMKIQIIHLVDDEELLPDVMLDSFWETLLNKDCSDSEDWGSELL